MFASGAVSAASLRRACACIGSRVRAGTHWSVQGEKSGVPALLVGGTTCVVAAAAFECGLDGRRQVLRRRMGTVSSKSRFSRCEAAPCGAVEPSRSVHGSGSRQVASATASGLSGTAPKDGVDFAIFQRPSGPLVNSEVEGSAAPHAALKALPGLLDAITSGVSQKDATLRMNVILLGEVHDDAVAHHLQLLLLKHSLDVCKAAGRRLVLSLEMFENDVQEVVDEYVVQKSIREQDFLQDTRPWGNYMQDYRPLVELCRDNGVEVIAANAARRYVGLTARGGSRALQHLLEQVPENAKLPRLLPPLPLPPASAAYHQKFVETIASQMPAAPAGSGDSGGECAYIGFKGRDVREARPEMMEAQLLWDHTMAQSIARALQSAPAAGTLNADDSRPPLVIHVCGAFHCAHGLGIPELLPSYLDNSAQPTAAATKQEQEQKPWLPIDDVLAAGGKDSSENEFGVKQSPPGVASVICWPASVKATVSAVRAGKHLPSLSLMGDWVIITEEAAE